MKKILTKGQMEAYFNFVKRAGYTIDDAIIFYGIFGICKETQSEEEINKLFNQLNKK